MKGPIAIIGAGPCGLTLARLLWRKNISFIVYEREASPAALAVSGSLDIRKETGQRALREAGLYKAFVEHARWEDDRVTFFDKSGNALHSNVGEKEVGEDGIMSGGEPEIDRKALRNILLGSIPQDKILWGRRLTSISFSDNTKRSPILNFANGDAVGGFPLIVGTDGAWSRVRAAITSASPQYTGIKFIETRIQPNDALYRHVQDKIGRGMGLFLAGPSRIVIQRQGDDSYRIYFGITAPEHFVNTTPDLSNPETTRDQLLRDFFSDWAEELKDYIRQSNNFRSWPLYQLPAESLNWAPVPGITLAGDAAHLSVPNGEGVNLAMKDALELVSKLEQYGVEGVDIAVKEYEKDMFIRGKDHIKDGESMERLMTHPGGAKAIVEGFAGAA